MEPLEDFKISLTDSIMALGGVSVSPTPVPTPGSGGGDPLLTRWDGTSFYFHGIPDIPYVLQGDLNVEVSFVTEPTELSPEKTFIKEGIVTCDDQQVRVGLDTATVNGTKILETPESVQVGIWKVWKHVGAGGESRVDIESQGWKVAVLNDDGTADIHAGDVLENVPHLGVFVDASPSDNLYGLLIDGNEDSEPWKYESKKVNI